MSQIGTWTRVEGTIEALGQHAIEERKELLQQEFQEKMVEEGLDPDGYTYEFIVRQQYNNAALDSYNDEPVFEENIPFITIAIKGIPKE